MINIEFYVLKSGEILCFKASGHANYYKKGGDIVCAAVSSALYMASNTLTDVIKIPVDLSTDDKGWMHAAIDQKDISAAKITLQGLKLHLKELEKQYPKNIKISFKEVD